MKKILLALFIVLAGSCLYAQETKVADPVVGYDAKLAPKGDLLVGKKWAPVSHTVNGKAAKINAKDFSLFLASGGYDATTNGVKGMGTWMYDSSTNKLTIRWSEKTSVWNLKEINDKGFTISNNREEMRFEAKAN